MNYLNYNFKYFMFHREGEIYTFLIYIFSHHFNYSSIPFIVFPQQIEYSPSNVVQNKVTYFSF